MKINQKILSIPPYVSTSWKNVISLHREERNATLVLIIGLVNGSTIEIPNLDLQTLESVFLAHEKYLESETPASPPRKKGPSGPVFPGAFIEDSALLSFPLPLGGEGNMSDMLQHNSAASNSPDLPKDVLEKIASLSKVVGIDQADQLPKPEPHCNCMHCQIMRVMRKEEESETCDDNDDEISDEDLKFREWDIEQSSEKLYLVSNPLNTEEHYTVFLGTPVGCTCGTPNCEHIRAVLNS